MNHRINISKYVYCRVYTFVLRVDFVAVIADVWGVYVYSFINTNILESIFTIHI